MAEAADGAERGGHRSISLASHTDLAGFKQAARGLLAEGVEPERASWHVASAVEGDLFAQEAAPQEAAAAPDGSPAAPPAQAVKVPAFFMPLCEKALLHADPNRFGLLYRLLWRLQHEPGLRHDPLDADRIAAEHLARAVRRDMHKMTAFVRFRPLSNAASGADEASGDAAAAAAKRWHVAWFEPEHHIVEATAPFFARRFAQMRWAILTPERCVRWDGEALAFGPGAQRDEAPPADAGEQLWLTYYAHIFNPARLKLKMMQKEMPRRYWHNLPEAVLIQPLTALASERSGRMVEQAAAVPAHRRPAASLALRLDARAAAQDEPGASSPVEASATSPAPAGIDAPESLASLHRATAQCRQCPLGALATQAVNGSGPIGAALMLVGEQPGDHEDLRGLPFVGPAGQLLDRALAQLGWPRETLYVTNAVRHFKYELRGKRRIHKSPAQREVAACLHWLESEIALVQPQALVALGATAARALMGRAVGVNAERGRWLQRGDGRRVLVTLHPSALLRMDPADKEAAYAQWLQDLRVAAPG